MRAGEFPQSVREQVLRRGNCEWCEGHYDQHDPWRVHHKIFLASEAARQFPLELLKSLSNGMLLHQGCHDSLHNQYDEPPQKTIDEVVRAYELELEELLRRPRQLSFNLSYQSVKRRIG